MIDRPGHRRDETEPRSGRARERGGIVCSADRLDTAYLRGDTDQRGNLAGVAAQHGHLDLVQQPPRRLGAIGRRPGADRVEHDRNTVLVGSPAREQHRVDPRGRQRADVQHQCAGDRDHLFDLLARVRHHRQRAQRERCVGGLVHDDVVGDLVDERLRLAQPPQGVTRLHAFLSR